MIFSNVSSHYSGSDIAEKGAFFKKSTEERMLEKSLNQMLKFFKENEVYQAVNPDGFYNHGLNYEKGHSSILSRSREFS